VKFLDYIGKCQMSAAKRLSERAQAAGGDASGDFYSLIMQTRRRAVPVPAEDVWGHRVVDD
jgi:hypothetical protein